MVGEGLGRALEEGLERDGGDGRRDGRRARRVEKALEGVARKRLEGALEKGVPRSVGKRKKWIWKK